MEEWLTFIEAIARMEGFFANDPHPTIPKRHNNPGDICAGQWANAHGAIPGAPDPLGAAARASRYAVFPDAETGWKALRALLTAHYAGLTVREAISKYAPATENDTDAYVRNMCAWTGLTADTVLTEKIIG